jgi:hypothetical protein
MKNPKRFFINAAILSLALPFLIGGGGVLSMMLFAGVEKLPLKIWDAMGSLLHVSLIFAPVGAVVFTIISIVLPKGEK